MEKLNVIRTDKETSEQELVTLDYAIEKLTGFWNNIEELLLKGEELFTPYATYKLNTNN